MAENLLQSLWAEPRVPNPPGRTWRDWAIIAVMAPLALIELAVRNDIVWPPVAFAVCTLIAGATLWRRSHPFEVAVLVFGTVLTADVASVIADAGGLIGLYTSATALIFPYALCRWASGRQAAAGLVVMSFTATFSTINEYTGIGDAIAGFIVLLFPALLGAEIRHLRATRQRAVDEIKLREREQLARELHDSVAHHVSAIAIQAQAGLAVAATHPDAASNALRVIEQEASRTLVEMRNIVGALRSSERDVPIELAPQPGIADIEQLARGTEHRSTHLPVVLDVAADDLGEISPSVDAAVYRIAQESITNAHRHAREATQVSVVVTADDDWVHLTVRDDGKRRPVDLGTPAGYGLIGMTERVHLLGGTIEVGPSPDRGWSVVASLPRNGGHT